MMLLVSIGETFVFGSLIAASILGLAVGIERVIVFRRNKVKIPDSFLSEIGLKLRRHDIAGAQEFVKQVGGGIYCRFVEFALQNYVDGHEGLSDLMEKKCIEEKLVLDRRLAILNTLGNNAPFIGLLGTVLGIIKAFYDLGTLGNTGAEVVMRSISGALMATATGLFVAIPAVIANNYFARSIKTIMANLDILSREILASYSHKKCSKDN